MVLVIILAPMLGVRRLGLQDSRHCGSAAAEAVAAAMSVVVAAVVAVVSSK